MFFTFFRAIYWKIKQPCRYPPSKSKERMPTSMTTKEICRQESCISSGNRETSYTGILWCPRIIFKNGPQKQSHLVASKWFKLCQYIHVFSISYLFNIRQTLWNRQNYIRRPPYWILIWPPWIKLSLMSHTLSKIETKFHFSPMFFTCRYYGGPSLTRWDDRHIGFQDGDRGFNVR